MRINLDDFFSSIVGEPNSWDGDCDSLASNLQMMSPEEVKRQLINSVTKQAEANDLQRQSGQKPMRSRSPEQAARKVQRVPTTVDHGGRAKPGTPAKPARVSTSKDAQLLQQENRQLRVRVNELQSMLKQEEKAPSSREAELGRTNEELKRAKGSVAKLSTQANQLKEKLLEAQKLHQQLRANLGASQVEVSRLSAKSEELTRQTEEKDASIAELRQSRQQLQAAYRALKQEYETLAKEHEALVEEHKTLLQELESETNSYTQRKQEILDTQLKTSLTEWNKTLNEYHPVPVDHDQLAQVSEVREQLRKSLVEQADAFRRNLSDITDAMAKLDRTRNAMREDLDEWQRDLYRANYDRLSLVLQSIDIEIWRTMEARLRVAAQNEAESHGEALAYWDELIDHLQMVSDYLRGACEVFGLGFFRPSNGEYFDPVRHQPYGSTAAAVPFGATIATCVATGVEVKTPDGDSALLRPAIVTLQE